MDSVLLPAAVARASMDLTLDNKDLLMRILLFLSAKSLIRYKSVCKKWLSVISADHFCHQHTLRHPKLQQSLVLQIQSIIQMDTPRFFYFNQTTNGEKVMIPYSVSVPYHTILQECNGLLLLTKIYQGCHSDCSDLFTTEEWKTEEKNICFVYNPTTKRSRKINMPISDKYPYLIRVSLAFDPSQSPYYKIVCFMSTSHLLIRSDSPYIYQIEVYDSESHTWKLNFEPYISHKRLFCDGTVYLNNSIYCWSEPLSCSRFDIAKNEIEDLTFPDHLYADSDFRYLQESNGHLYRFQLADSRHTIKVAVWELQSGGDDRSRWLLKYHHQIFHHFPIDYDRRPLGELDIEAVRIFMGGSDSDSDKLLIYEPGKMRAYNFIDKSYEELVDLPNNGLSIKGFLFGEVLALV